METPAEDAEAALDQKHLKTLARSLSAKDAHVVSIPAQHHQPKREALLHMSFQEVRVQPPLHGACLRQTEITAWVVRVWETKPPEGQEPLEWILLTTLPLTCASDAWEGVQWYGWRWLLEDFHKALKTGCRMEHHFLQTIEAQWRLLAILTPIALRLLVIRQTAQQAEEIPATDVVSPEALQVVTHLDQRHRTIGQPKNCGTLLPVWEAISTARVMARRDGRPYGKDGCGSWMSCKASISPPNSILLDFCGSVRIYPGEDVNYCSDSCCIFALAIART